MNRDNIEIVTRLKGIFAASCRIRSLWKVNIENEIKSNMLVIQWVLAVAGPRGPGKVLWALYWEREGYGRLIGRCGQIQWRCGCCCIQIEFVPPFSFWVSLLREHIIIKSLILQTSLSISEFNSPIGAINCGVISIGGYNYWGGMINYRQTLI